LRRIDGFLDARAPGLRANEVNQAAPSFLHFHDALARIHRDVLGELGIEHAPKLIAPLILDWLLLEYRDRFRGAQPPSLVAVTTEEGFPHKAYELPPFVESVRNESRARNLGVDFVLCHPH